MIEYIAYVAALGMRDEQTKKQRDRDEDMSRVRTPGFEHA